MGLAGQGLVDVFLKDVKVPKENLLGDKGKGFSYSAQMDCWRAGSTDGIHGWHGAGMLKSGIEICKRKNSQRQAYDCDARVSMDAGRDARLNRGKQMVDLQGGFQAG